MFDISWTEFLLIGVVALVVIGPKELPGVMRTLGQWTRKVRAMASDFQGQFQEAMREAEMGDLKQQVDDIAHSIKSYDPLKDVRTDIEAVGKDVEASLSQPASAGAANETAEAVAPAEAQAAAPAPLEIAPPTPTVEPALPAAVEEAAAPDSTGRTG